VKRVTCASVGWLLSLKSMIFSEHSSSTATMARVIPFCPSIDVCTSWHGNVTPNYVHSPFKPSHIPTYNTVQRLKTCLLNAYDKNDNINKYNIIVFWSKIRPNAVKDDVSAWCRSHHHHTTTTTVLRPFFRNHPGELVPEENFWTLWCKGRLTQADTLTFCPSIDVCTSQHGNVTRLGATPSRLTNAHLHLTFFTGRMPFLPPNQQCEGTEGRSQQALISEQYREESHLWHSITTITCIKIYYYCYCYYCHIMAVIQDNRH